MAELDGHEMAKLIRCRRCSATFTSHAIHPPAVCPSCVVVLERRLAMATLPDEPRATWELTHNDKRFLSSLRIGAD